MLTFLNLKYFLSLTEELNYRTTAVKLHMSQQCLSGHIKKMEDDLGVKLFNYGPPLTITPAGLLLKDYALDITDKFSSMETGMSNMKKAHVGSLRIGCTYARGQFLLPPIISEFHLKHPLIKINLLEGNTPDIENALNQDEIDVAVGFIPKGLKNIDSIPLYDDPFRLVVHPSVLEESFPDKKPIYFRCFEEKLIKEITSNCPFLTMIPKTTIGMFGTVYLKQINVVPNIFLELRDVGTMLAMCYAKMGFMLCPETLINKSCYPFSKQHLIYPLPNHNSRSIAINYQHSLKKSKILQAFIDIVSKSLNQ